MTKELLLEAIGYVDEQLLIEAKETPRRGHYRIGRVVLIAAIIALLTISVMASTGFFAGLLKAEENGSSVSNLSTGMGNFVYTEDGIYYGEPGFIYKCDFSGKVVKTYPLSDEFETPHYMFATADAIIYVNIGGLAVEPEDATAPNREDYWGLRVLPLDGSDPYSICQGVDATFAYADGNLLYVNNGGKMLCRIDLVTMEKTDLLENVPVYFIDDTYIYAVKADNEKRFYRSQKDAICFEPVELSFDPNKVVADGEDLYICEYMSKADQRETGHKYRVNLVRDGQTIPLPIFTWFYQVLDGCILYQEEETYALKCYNVSTGKTTTLAKNVFEFSVLEDRYICIKTFNDNPIIYDWQTGSYSEIKIAK